jgi:hypothetical protein
MFPRLDPAMYPIEDDQQFFMELLRATRVMLVQGTGFNYPTTSTFASCSCRTRRPARGHRPLARFLEQYRKRHAKPPACMPLRSCSRLIGAGQNGFCLDFRYLNETHPSRPAGHRHRRSGTFNVLPQPGGNSAAPGGIELTMVARRDLAKARAIVGDAVAVTADPRDIIAIPTSTSSSS